MEAGSVQKLTDAILQVCKGVVQYSPGMQMEAISMLWEKKTETYVSLRKEMNAVLNGRGRR